MSGAYSKLLDDAYSVVAPPQPGGGFVVWELHVDAGTAKTVSINRVDLLCTVLGQALGLLVPVG